MSAPLRPSHWHEPPEERTDNRHSAPPDYPTEDYPAPVYGLPEGIDPIPVYITENPPRERPLVRWLPLSGTANASQRQAIASNDRRRQRTIVRNTDTANTLYITYDANVSNAAFAFALPFGQREEFLHNGQMYVFAAPTLTATFSTFTEFEIDDE